MATFLDVTGLAAFSKIFVFVLVLLVLYAVFASNQAFGGAKWIAWLIALVVAIFVILSDLATGLIQHISPWFAVLFVFVIFIPSSGLCAGSPGDFLIPAGQVFLVFFYLQLDEFSKIDGAESGNIGDGKRIADKISMVLKVFVE